MDDIPSTIEINDALYHIEEAATGWSYSRDSKHDDLEDSAGGFDSHIEAIQAAMEHERGRDEELEDIQCQRNEMHSFGAWARWARGGEL